MRAVYLDCASLKASDVSTAPGRRALAWVKDFAEALQECFPPDDAHGPYRWDVFRSACLRALGVTAAAVTAWDMLNTTQALLRSSDEVVMIVDGRGAFVAGCTTRRRSDGSGRTKRNEIDNVCVRKAHRGKGICQLLVSSVTRLYADRGDDVKIVCLSENAGACSCYRKLFLRSRPSLRGVTSFTGVRLDAVSGSPPRRVLPATR